MCSTACCSLHEIIEKKLSLFFSLVTPHSHLYYRVLDHNSFRKDSLIGEKKINLYELLKHCNGVCEHLELMMELNRSHTSTSNGSETQGQSASGAGVLVSMLHGMRVDMNLVGPSGHAPNMYGSSNGASNGTTTRWPTLPRGKSYGFKKIKA